MAINQPQSDLLDNGAAAAFLGVKPGTLDVWRSTGRYSIPFVKVGRLVRYKRADLQAFIENRTMGVAA